MARQLWVPHRQSPRRMGTEVCAVFSTPMIARSCASNCRRRQGAMGGSSSMLRAVDALASRAVLAGSRRFRKVTSPMSRSVLFDIPLRQPPSVLHGCERIGPAVRHEETKVMSQGISERNRLPPCSVADSRGANTCADAAHQAPAAALQPYRRDPARAPPGARGEGRARDGGRGAQMMKAASTLSDEAGLPNRETGLREFAEVRCSTCSSEGAYGQASSLGRRASGRCVFAGAVSLSCPRTRRCRVLALSEAASYQLSPQPLRQLHAVHETPPIATAAAQDGLAIGLRTTARSASELPNERQVVRVLASAHAAALNARRPSHPETAAAAVR